MAEDPREFLESVRLVKHGADLTLRAELIDFRVGSEGSPEYYVHFVGTDRRNDEWVSTACVDLTDSGKRSPHPCVA